MFPQHVFPDTAEPADLHGLAERLGASAWRFACASSDDNDAAMTPLSAGARRLNELVLHAMNPAGVFDPGRMFRTVPSEANPIDSPPTSS